MESLIYPLIVAAISGLTFVAWQQPSFYDKVFSGKLYLLGFAGLLLYQFWDMSLAFALAHLKEFIPDENAEKASATIEALKTPSKIVVGIWGLIVVAFFLSWLSNHRIFDDMQKKTNN